MPIDMPIDMPSVLTCRRLRGLGTSQFPIWDVSIPD